MERVSPVGAIGFKFLSNLYTMGILLVVVVSQ